MSRKDYLQYGRRQYGLKQYGRYKGEEVPSEEGHVYQFKKARIRARINNDYTAWIIQHSPVYINEKIKNIRLTTNTGEVTYAQTLILNGEHRKIRLRTTKEEIISEII